MNFSPHPGWSGVEQSVPPWGVWSAERPSTRFRGAEVSLLSSYLKYTETVGRSNPAMTARSLCRRARAAPGSFGRDRRFRWASILVVPLLLAGPTPSVFGSDPGPPVPLPTPAGSLVAGTVSNVIVPIGHPDLVGIRPALRAGLSAPPAHVLPTRPGTVGHSAVAHVFVAAMPPIDSTPGVQVGRGWEGVNDSNCACAPPDVQDAAGPTQVAEMVNLYFEVWDHSGVLLAGEDVYSFFAVPYRDFATDPRIVYDNLSGRWFASIAVLGGVRGHALGSISLAVSSTSNATGNWTLYSSLAAPSNDFPDQPILGVSSDLVAVAGNDFSLSSGAFVGDEYWVVNKSSLVHGTGASQATFAPDPGAFSLHPARTLSAGGPMFLAENSVGSPGTLRVLRLSGVPPGPVTANSTNLSVLPISNAMSAPTPGSAAIDSGTSHVDDALWAAGRLYVLFTDGCTIGAQSLACVRLDVVNTTPSPTLAQDADFGIAGAYIFYPAASLDPSGNLLIDVAVSSGTIPPGVLATVHAPNDSAGHVGAFSWVIRGAGGPSSSVCGAVCRYGDYFGSGADPTSTWVWVGGEYITSTNNWQTWIAPVRALGPMSARAVVAPGSADVGQDVNVTLAVANASCVPGAGSWCSAYVPLGDGTNLTATCVASLSTVSTRRPYAAGSYLVGSGGWVAAFNASGCGPTNRTSIVPLTAVSLAVSTSPAVRLSVAPALGEVGVNLTFVASSGGGRPPYSFSWSGLPPGCLDAPSPTLTCVPSASGSYTVSVSATDANRGFASDSAVLRVVAAPVALLKASASRLEMGQPVDLTGSVESGSGPFSYSWVGLPPGCRNIDAPFQTCRPDATGTFLIRMAAADGLSGQAESSPVNLTVLDPPSVRVQLSPSSPKSGESVTITAMVSGGAGPVNYLWVGVPPGCPAGNVSTIACAPPSGQYNVSVTIRDALNGTASAAAPFAIPAPAAGTRGVVLWIGLGLAGVAAGAVAIILYRRLRPEKR
jgi:hypothetical protein